MGEAKLRQGRGEIALNHIRWSRPAFLPPSAAGSLDGKQQAGAQALSGGGAGNALPEKAETGLARRLLVAASPGRTPTPGLVHGCQIRYHSRWQQTEVPQHDR